MRDSKKVLPTLGEINMDYTDRVTRDQSSGRIINSAKDNNNRCNTCGCKDGGGYINSGIGFDQPCPECNLINRL